MSGQGGGLGTDAFHQIPVTAHDISVMIDDGAIPGFETGRQVALHHGHADRVGKSLTQGTGGGLDPGGMAVFGMAGGFAAPLPEFLDVFQAQIVSAEVE